MASMIQQEIAKYMAGKLHGGCGKSDSDVFVAHFPEYIGKPSLDQVSLCTHNV